MNKMVLMIFSLLLSLILTVLPLSAAWNPAWCLLTLLFWNYRYPGWVSVGAAWCVGILVDALTGSLFGLHALSFALVVYLFDMFYRRFQMFPVVQQGLVMGLFVVIDFFITTSLAASLTNSTVLWSTLFSAITSAICWPIYLAIGKKLHLSRN